MKSSKIRVEAEKVTLSTELTLILLHNDEYASFIHKNYTKKPSEIFFQKAFPTVFLITILTRR